MRGDTADRLNGLEESLQALHEKPRERWTPATWRQFETLCARWNALQEEV
jgi:hypothetical protein